MVIVSCFAKLHAFNLAEQLEKHKLLRTFYTSYAYQKNTFWRNFVRRKDFEKVTKDNLSTIISSAIGRKLYDDPFFWNEYFDKKVAQKLKKRNDYDCLIGWSGMSSHSFEVAKGKGKKIILVRGSAHIQKQEALLKEEYKKINVDFEIDNRIIQKELLEYKMADFIDVPSKFAYNSFIEYGINTQKLTINTLAIDKEFNSKKNALLHKTTYEKIRILYLGHLSIRKGIIYLLKAIEAISKQNTNIELWLVGGITKELHDIVEKYKQYPFIKFFGHIPKEELNTVLTQCTIGVLPSIEDGFGQVIPEMLSYGIPVIVTENCGGSDLIDDGQNGFLIPAQSSEALVEKITYLFNREELKRMSICASKTVGRSFNWDHYGDKYVAFLKSL